jgi:hypothetical protein
LNESTGGSNGLSKSVRAVETKAETPKRRRRFSTESANDLLFWGAHLAIVAISLGIMWVKFEANSKALEKLLKAQNREIDLVRAQALKADEVAQTAQNAERQRSLAFTAAQRQIEALVAQTQGIQTDVKSSLATANQTNQLVLDAISVAKAAALKSEEAAQSAAGNAGVAAARAGAAAASSGRTANVVATKVVTQSDKAEIRAQQQALATKQRQLSNTIRRVKKTGPTFWDKLLH